MSCCTKFLAIIALVHALAATAIGSGLTNTWVDGNGKWEKDANWSRTVAPSSFDPADTITNGGTVTIDATTVLSNGVNGCMTISNLFLSAVGSITNTLSLANAGSATPLRVSNIGTVGHGGSVSITNSALEVDGAVFGALTINGGVQVNNATLAATNVPGAIVIGTSGSGSLSVQNSGWLRTQGLYLGVGGNGTMTLGGGTISVSATFSTGTSTDSLAAVWITGGQLIATNTSSAIGDGGNGRMTVSNGTMLASTLYVGANIGAQGTLTIAGGTNSVSSYLSLGTNPGATGTVWLTGGQLVITNANTHVGDTSVGQMTVSNGTLLANNLYVGANSGGQGTLTIAGGTNSLLSFLDVAANPNTTGAVWLTGGQLITTNADTYVGYSGLGQVTMSNGTWLAYVERVGYTNGSSGTLTIAGGTNSLSSNLNLGYFAGAAGTVWVTGGQLTASNGTAYVGYGGAGQMTVSNGTVTVSSLMVTNNTNGSIINTNVFTLVGGVVNSANTFVNNGLQFAVGNGISAATYNLLGGIHSFANNLEIRANAAVTGDGAISGNVVIDSGGIAQADFGGNLNLNGTVTNNGTVTAKNGAVLNFYGLVVNNSIINATNGGAHFFSTLQNNGTILGAALTNSWTDGSAKWETAGNWSLRSQPSATDLADIITNAVSKTVTIDATTVSAAPGSLTISNLFVSAPFGSINTLSLNNAGLILPLHVGDLLSLSNNSAVIINNSFLQIDGEVSMGFDGGGGDQLIITNGGRLVSGGQAIVGGLNSSNNIVVVTGPNSSWVNTNNSVAIQNSNPGVAMVVSHGGQFTGFGVFVGYFGQASSNVVLLTDPGSTWTNLGILSIGETDIGDEFIVSNGASLYTASALIGYPGGQNHSVVVTGSNSLWRTDGVIKVGFGDTGDSLTINAGGSLIASNGTHTAEVVVDAATLLLGDGSFSADNLVVTNGGTVQYTSTYRVDNATVTVSSGTVQANSNLTVAAAVSSTGTVNVTGGQLVTTNGVIGVGNDGTATNGFGVGTMTVSNGTVLANQILLGSTVGGQGQLTVQPSGLVSLVGTGALLVANDVTVDGGDVEILNGQIYCGKLHPGAMTMSNGTANSQITYVGYDSQGTLTMVAGQMTVSSLLQVGFAAGSTGAVWMSGGQLTATALATTIGNQGVGQMSISNGVVTTADLFIGNSSNPGTLTLAGGTLTVNSLVLLNSGSRFNFSRGCLNALGITNSNGQALTLGNGVTPITLNLLGGSSSLLKGLKIATNATFAGFGTINGSVLNYGIILPGGGTLTFTGSVTNNGLIVTNSSIHFVGGLVNNGLLLDPTADTDGDGMNNLNEILAGTNPNNSASLFHITAIATTGNDVNVSWSTVGGKSYVVQVGSAAASGYTNNFIDLSPVIAVPGIGESTTNFFDFGGATNKPSRYYRIRLAP